MTDLKRGAYETRAAGLIARFLPFDEEQSPIPESPAPAMLVVWVTERLTQAGFELACRREDEHGSFLKVAGYFLAAAAHAIGATPHVHPTGEHVLPIEFKEAMLHELDAGVMANAELDSYADRRAEQWLPLTLSLLAGATQGACELDGLSRLNGAAEEEEEEMEDEDEIEDEDELGRIETIRSEIADSLLDVAIMAATAGQWFAERYDEQEDADLG